MRVNFKRVSELGLEIIKLDDQVLLVDKLEHTNNRLILHQSINGKVNHFYKGDDIDLEDYNARRFLGLTFNVIASTKPLEGVPLLVIEDEVQKMADERFPEDGVHDNRMWQAVGFVKGYNKAKETYKFTEEDLRKALWELGDVLFNNNQHGIKEGEPKIYFDGIIQSLTKKELWIEVEFKETKSAVFRENDAAPYGKYEPKITNNQIKAVWK